MNPIQGYHYKALCGCDYIRENGLPVKRTENGWIAYANKQAKKQSNKHVVWNAVCAYIDFRECFRISYASQSYNILTGTFK